MVDEKQYIAKEVTRRLNNPNAQIKSKVELSNASDQSIKHNFVDLDIKREKEGKQIESNLRIKFISTASNSQSMLKAIEKRALEVQKKSPLIQKSSDKKDNYAETLNYLSKNLECY